MGNLLRKSPNTLEQAGGHEGSMTTKGSKVFKKAKLEEKQFYQWVFDNQSNRTLQELKFFIPKYFGTLQNTLVLENLLHGLHYPNIMDCKLGKVTWTEDREETSKKRQQELSQTTTTGTLGFRISGIVIKDSSGTVIETWNKNSLSKITSENIHQEFLKVVALEKAIDPNTVENIIIETQKILKWFETQQELKFLASSLLFLVDKQCKTQVKLIDFAHVSDSKGETDHNVIEGIRNIIATWQEVKMLCK